MSLLGVLEDILLCLVSRQGLIVFYNQLFTSISARNWALFFLTAKSGWIT